MDRTLSLACYNMLVTNGNDSKLQELETNSLTSLLSLAAEIAVEYVKLGNIR